MEHLLPATAIAMGWIVQASSLSLFPALATTCQVSTLFSLLLIYIYIFPIVPCCFLSKQIEPRTRFEWNFQAAAFPPLYFYNWSPTFCAISRRQAFSNRYRVDYSFTFNASSSLVIYVQTMYLGHRRRNNAVVAPLSSLRSLALLFSRDAWVVRAHHARTPAIPRD